MSYRAEISRRNPSCIIFLIDQSGSMSQRFGGGNDTKAQGAADAINKLLQELVLKCTKEDGVRDYFDIAMIGYGIREGYAGPLVGQNFVKLSQLAEQPLNIEERMKKEPNGAGGTVEVKVKFPIWVEPVASSNTPMCRALKLGLEWARKWITEHPEAFPPIAFNITDGEATDGDPEHIAKEIMELSTSDGNVLMFNCHISGTKASSVLFPAAESELPTDQFAKKLFRMSSILPEPILDLAGKEGFDVKEKSRGFAFNADLVDLIDILDIGTRVSREQLR